MVKWLKRFFEYLEQPSKFITIDEHIKEVIARENKIKEKLDPYNMHCFFGHPMDSIYNHDYINEKGHKNPMKEKWIVEGNIKWTT